MNIINIVIESGYKFNNRFTKIVNGIVSMGRLNSCSLNPLSLNEIELAPRYNTPIIVLGASSEWTTDAIKQLLLLNYHPIIVGFYLSVPNCTYISQNHFLDAYSLSKWFLSSHHEKCAFLGFNPLSFCDIEKNNGLHLALEKEKIDFNNNDTYELVSTIENCINDFLPYLDNYKTIFCVNDTIAFFLISKIKHHSNYNIISFGDLALKKYSSVPFYSISPDYYQIGELSVKMYLMMQESVSISSSTIYLKSKFHISTGETLNEVSDTFTLSSHTEHTLSYDNTENLQDVPKIDLLNNAINSCDDEDLKILKYIQSGMTYEKIAELLYMSSNSVKHRLKKIFNTAKINGKNDLIALFDTYKLKF